MTETRLGLFMAASLSALACGASKRATGEPLGISAQPNLGRAAFDYSSLDKRPVSSQALAGSIAVMSFVTSWDMPSQLQTDILVRIAPKESETRFVLVALEGPQNRELVDAYAKTLHVPFPVALADDATIAGKSSFGVIAVPATVILDPTGAVVWQRSGVVPPDELRRAIASARVMSR